MEKVSVIIPLYNKEKCIARAIGSVLNQTYVDFELIIINDGSTDQSEQIVKNFNDQRIRLYTKDNGGVSSARNMGIAKAKFEYVALLDGDDWWREDFLSKLISLKNKFPDSGIWAGRYVQVNEVGKQIELNRFPQIEEGFFELFDYLYAICSSSVLIRKSVFDECGYFNEELTHGEDTDMWIRIALKYNICYTNETISYYNIASNPLMRSIGKIPNIENHILITIDNYIGNGFPKWDELLTKRKANYLLDFYIQNPHDARIKDMIKSLPIEIRQKKEFEIFHLPFIRVWILHIQRIIIQRIVYFRNFYFYSRL